MRITSTIVKTSLVLVALLGFCSIASAQATRTWVSGVGDDANPCSRTAPCKTFSGAISKTATSGEINVLDPGGFGGVTITKSITIDGGGFIASALVAGTNAIIINGAGAKVQLRNLQIMGLETGIDGIRFLNGKSLTLDNVRVQGFNSGASNGISFLPADSAGVTSLTITNSIVSNSGGTTGFGILVRPTAPSTARVMLDNVVSTQNSTTGFRAENGSTVAITNSTFSNNANSGIQALSVTNGNVQINLDNVVSANNGFNGIKSDGSANSIIIMSNTAVYGNLTGLNSAASGQILSFQNNRVAGNVTDNGPTGVLNQD